MDRWASTVPGTINALVRIFTLASQPGAPLEGVVVRDGPAVESTAALEVLSVGWTGVVGETDVDTQVLAEGLGNVPDREQATIRCAAAVLAGNTNVAAARARAYQIMNAAGAVIVADRTLQGAVMDSRVSGHSLSQDQTDRGLQAVVVFAVDCDAFTPRS
jgi:hypothetical protein